MGQMGDDGEGLTDRIGEVDGGSNGGISEILERHYDIVREPGKYVGNVLCIGCSHPYFVAPVVVHGWAKIPPVHSVWHPCATDTWFFMDQQFRTMPG
jgi:hypothetical protein